MKKKNITKTNKLLIDFINDIKVEAVKFRLQTAVPHSEIQHNDIMGNFDFQQLNSEMIGDILGAELRNLEKLINSYDYVPILTDIIKHWNDKRLEIQYDGYGSGDKGCKRRTEAWCYVLLKRILRKRHKELNLFVKKR